MLVRGVLTSESALEFVPVSQACALHVGEGEPAPACLKLTRSLLDGARVTTARVGRDQVSGEIVVVLELDRKGNIWLLLGFTERNPGITRLLLGDALTGENERLHARVDQFFSRIESQFRQVLREAGECEERTRSRVADVVAWLRTLQR